MRLVCPAPATVAFIACAWLSPTVFHRRVWGGGGDSGLPSRSGKGIDSVPGDSVRGVSGCSPTGLARASDTDLRRESVCKCNSHQSPRAPETNKPLHLDSWGPQVLPQPESAG